MRRRCRRREGVAAARRDQAVVPRVEQQRAQRPLRTLLLYAGDDRLVAPRGSDAFAAAAAAAQAPVTAQRLPALYHEIFNETDTAPVLSAFASWLDSSG